jgi:hypothetical protein
MDFTDNIIPFPKKNHNFSGPASPQSIDEVEETVDLVRQVHIQQTLEQVIPMLFDNLSLAGFQPANEMDFLKDGALIVEAARSFLNKTYSISHPLQLIAENLFEQTDSDGNLEVSDKIKIVITPIKEKS